MSATHHGDSQAPVCLHPTDLTQLRPFVEEARDIWYSKDPDVSPEGSRRKKDAPVDGTWIHLEENVSNGVVKTVKIRQTPGDRSENLDVVAEDWPKGWGTGKQFALTFVPHQAHGGFLLEGHEWHLADPKLGESPVKELAKVHVPPAHPFAGTRNFLGETYIQRIADQEVQHEYPFVHRCTDGTVKFLHRHWGTIHLDIYLNERISLILGSAEFMLHRMWQGFEYNEHVNPGVAFYHLRALIENSGIVPGDRRRVVQFSKRDVIFRHSDIKFGQREFVFAEYVEHSKRLFSKITDDTIYEYLPPTSSRARSFKKYSATVVAMSIRKARIYGFVSESQRF